MRTGKFLVVFGSVLLSLSVWAQAAPYQPAGDRQKPMWLFDVAGGVTIPTGAAAPRFDVGWNAKGGIGVNLSQAFAVEAEYLFSSLAVDSSLLGASLSGRQYIHTFGLSGMLSAGRNVGLSAYVIGGPAGYYRRITISEFAGTAIAPYCDPYFFYCYSTPVSVSNVIGSRSEWDFGLNGGLGLQYGFPGGEPHVFLEARYHYVFGQSYGTANRSVNSSIGFVPILLGVRW